MTVLILTQFPKKNFHQYLRFKNNVHIAAVDIAKKNSQIPLDYKKIASPVPI
jgi:hypothetical protein